MIPEVWIVQKNGKSSETILKELLRARFRNGDLNLSNELKIRRTKFGKPYFEDTTVPLEFSISHSQARVAVAICRRDLQLGVDLERVRPRATPCELLVERFFSPNEIHYWRGCDRRMQWDAFYKIWTRKEAYLKCLGIGISVSLSSFSSIEVDSSDLHAYTFDESKGLDRGWICSVFIKVEKCTVEPKMLEPRIFCLANAEESI